MPKRFTDSLKWDDPFFSDLPNNLKLLWIFMLDKCDHAGIYKVNKKMAEFCLGFAIDWEQVKGVFKGRVHPLNDEKWFISKFIDYQYGTLDNNNRVHSSIIRLLEKEGAYKLLERSVHKAMDKDKDKVKDKETESLFAYLWDIYPRKDGRKEALKHFKATVHNQSDYDRVKKATHNYAQYIDLNKTEERFTKKGSTFFNNWEDWVDYKDSTCPKCKGSGEFMSDQGYKCQCDCKDKR